MKETRKFSPKVLVWILPLIAVVAGVVWKFNPRPGARPAGLPAEVLTAPVVVDRFVQELVESGEIESSSNVEVRCEVGTGSAGVALLEVVPEGTYVKEGDFLARLDDTNLKERLITRQIDVNMSQAALAQAKADLENAKLQLEEYKSGLYREEEEKLEGEEFVARENLRRAEEYLQYSENLAAKGYVSAVQLEADRFALEKASKELDVARTRLEVLRKYTREKMLSSFEAGIETATVRLSSAQKAYEIDKAQLEEVETQLANCVIKAPSSGQVVYANDNATSDQPLIEEGKMVREKQVLFRLPDRSRMQMSANINESRIDKVRPGMPVRIKVEAIPNGVLTGELVKLTEYPVRSANVYVSHIKNYGATILIDNPPEALRPGMTAQATIVLSEEAQALQVPIQSVVERDKRYFVVVSEDGGDLQVREVAIGEANLQSIVIEAGLDQGEQVALSPATFIDQMTLPDPKELVARRETSKPLIAVSRDNPS
jgi:RND family efflux transporter MFP subunit